MMKINTLLAQIQSQMDLDAFDAQLIACHVLKMNRAGLFIYDKSLDEQSINEIQSLSLKRSDGIPLAYLIGYKDFWTLKLKVTKDTLIPRPETELIIEKALSLYERGFSGEILDLGTGTGAIALSLAAEFPESRVLAVDLSEAALKVAAENVEINQLRNVKLEHSSWFENISGKVFDLIVSNPPYIEQDDPHLKHLKSEPIEALVAGDQGLADIRHIISNSKRHLNKGGWLILEHGYNQGREVRESLRNQGYINIKTDKDYARMPRISFGQVAIE